MKKIKDLIRDWQTKPVPRFTQEYYSIRLSVQDAARIEALAELYPNVTREEIITDLITSGLDEVEASLPYIPGGRVIAVDEFGDPIYEDVGPSSSFHKITRNIAANMKTDTQFSDS